MSLGHPWGEPGPPMRVVAAFGVDVLRLARTELDLLTGDRTDRPATMPRPIEALIAVSPKPPCKSWSILGETIAMAAPLCSAPAARPVSHLDTVSSDAVYGDRPVPLTEESPASGSPHGAMHLVRETRLADAAGDTAFAIDASREAFPDFADTAPAAAIVGVHEQALGGA